MTTKQEQRIEKGIKEVQELFNKKGYDHEEGALILIGLTFILFTMTSEHMNLTKKEFLDKYFAIVEMWLTSKEDIQ